MERLMLVLILVLSVKLVLVKGNTLTGNGLAVKFSVTSFKACMKSDSVLNKVIQVSLQQCVDECASRGNCRAVNYFRHFHLCELLPVDDGNLYKSGGSNRACVLVKKADMDLSEIQTRCTCAAGESCDVDPHATCTKKECEPVNLENGQVFGNMLSLGSKVTFECDQMYTEVNRKTEATCLANGTWSYYPKCEPVKSSMPTQQNVKECEPVNLENGQVFGNMLSFGSKVTFECDQMYTEVNRKSEATCLANGTWSYYPKCKRDCNDPPQQIRNATFNNGRTYEGQNRTFECIQGLIFPNGNIAMTITCQSDGQWSAMLCPTVTDENNTCTGCILPRDCQDRKVVNESTQTGLYDIYPVDSDGFEARCDMDTSPGGWTVIQRRISKSNFKRNWEEYKNGFGDLNDNFWLGNDKIWKLTNSGQYKLRVDLKDQNRDTGYAEYSSFSIGDESSKYALNITGHSGTASDSLINRHNGMMFSTFDQDNDNHTDVHFHCADTFKGGWWYSDCQSSNLNGPYGSQGRNKGMTWKCWRDESVFMTFTEMKIRRK